MLDSPYTTFDQVRFLPENQWLDMDQARQITNVDTSKKMDVWLKAEITNEQNIEYWTIANTLPGSNSSKYSLFYTLTKWR